VKLREDILTGKLSSGDKLTESKICKDSNHLNDTLNRN
jgi:DNA-binding GntR family transcriptional regulator